MERLTSSESLYRQTVSGECVQLPVSWVAGGTTYSFAVVDKQDIQQVLEVSRGDKIRVCLYVVCLCWHLRGFCEI